MNNSYENRMVFILALGGGIAALDAGAAYFLMPFIAADLSLSNSQIGLIAAAVTSGWAISGFLVSLISDRTGRKKPFLVGAFLGVGIFSALSALASNFVTLFLARLTMGFSEGPIIPVTQSVVIAESSPNRVALNMGIAQNLGANLLGAIAAPIILVAMATHFGWRTAFLLAGIPGLIIAFVIYRYVREPTIDQATSDVKGQIPSGKSGSAWSSIKAIIKVRNVRLCIAIVSCSIAWHVLILAFLPLWVTNELNITPSKMSIFLALIGLAGVVSAIIVPALSDRIGRKPTIILFAAIGVLAPLGPVFLQSSPILFGLLIFGGAFMLGAFPLMMATVPMESVKPIQRATTCALVIGTGQILGGVCGPVIGGILADQFGAETPLYLSAALAAAASVIALMLVERPASMDKREILAS